MSTRNLALVLIIIVVTTTITQGTARDWSKVYRRHQKITFPPKIRLNTSEQRVVGGIVAEPHSFPHQVALFLDVGGRTYFCGGSLISTRYVLTAAHCPQGATGIEVVFGAHNIRNASEPTQVRIVAESYVIHEEYDPEYIKNDIALILLPKNSVQLSDIIQLVSLPNWSDASEDFVDENSVISGWGKTSDTETTYTDLLQFVEAPIITNEECRSWYFGLFIEKTNVCASGLDGKSPCNGDSGGALLVGGKQVGIASFGVSFGCEIDFPGAYTRVTSYLDWIETNSDIIIK